MTVWLPLHQTQNKIIQETSTKGSHWQKWQLTLCVDVIALKMCQKCNVVICVFWPNVLHHWLMFHFFMTLVSLMSSDHQLVGQLCCKENWVHSSLLLKGFCSKQHTWAPCLQHFWMLQKTVSSGVAHPPLTQNSDCVIFKTSIETKQFEFCFAHRHSDMCSLSFSHGSDFIRI